MQILPRIMPAQGAGRGFPCVHVNSPPFGVAHLSDLPRPEGRQHMAQVIRYRGNADSRVITDATFTAHGLSSPTIVWQQSNGYEVTVDDPIAAFLLAQGDFEPGDPGVTFASLFDTPVVTDWAAGDTWTSPVAYEEVPISADGTQDFVYSVVNRRGRVTGPVTPPGNGNHRVAMLHPHTNWKNSEMLSLWFGPSQFSLANQTPTNRPQMGHLHQVQVGEGGARSRGYAVWANIFGGPNPEVLQMNLVEFDGTTLWQGAGATGGAKGAVNRAGVIVRGQRFTFIGQLEDLIVHPPYAAASIPNGAACSVADSGDTSYNNPATVAVASASRAGGVQTVNTSAVHGLAVGDPYVLDLSDNTFDGLFYVDAVVDTDTVTTNIPGVTDDASGGTGTLLKPRKVEGSAPGDSKITVKALGGADGTDRTGGGIITPYYPWAVYPMWIKTSVIDGVITAKQWAFGNPEPDDGVVVGVTQATPAVDADTQELPDGPGLCGIWCAHAHSGSYFELGAVRYRRLPDAA